MANAFVIECQLQKVIGRIVKVLMYGEKVEQKSIYKENLKKN